MTTDNNFNQKSMFCDKLLACPILTTSEGFRAVVASLPPSVRERKVYRDNLRADVLSLVESCLDSGNLYYLYQIITFLDKDTFQFKALQNHIFEPYLRYQLEQPGFRASKGYYDSNELLSIVQGQPATSIANHLTDDDDEWEDLFFTVTAARVEVKIDPQTPTDFKIVPTSSARRSRSLDHYLSERNRLVLVGAPGAGKSTLLRRLFVKLANCWRNPSLSLSLPDADNVPEVLRGLYPIYVPLNRWQTRTQSIAQYVAEQLQAAATDGSNWALSHMFYELIAADSSENNNKIVLLLDGVNEIPKLGRDTQQLINDQRFDSLINISSKVRVVVSCRENDFLIKHQKVESWAYLNLLPLEQNDVIKFSNWYVAKYNQRVRDTKLASPVPDNFVTNLAGAIYDTSRFSWWQQEFERQKRWQEVVSQPFYLVRLLAFCCERKLEGLPHNRVELHKNEVDSMIALALKHTKKLELGQEPQQGRLSATFNQPELEERLALLAFNMTDAGQVGATTFELATRWLTDRRTEDLPGRTDNDQDKDDKDKKDANTHIQAPEAEAERNKEKAGEWLEWGITTNLLVRLPEGGVAFAHQLLQEYFAALYCREHVFTSKLAKRVFNNPQFRQVRELWQELPGVDAFTQAQSVLEDVSNFGLDPEAQANALVILGENGNHPKAPSVVKLIVSLLESEHETVRERAAYALRGYGKYQEQARITVEALLKALTDPSSSVREQVVTTLQRYGSYEHNARLAEQSLVELLTHKDAFVQLAATKALAGYGDDLGGETAIEPLLDLLFSLSPSAASASASSSVSSSNVTTDDFGYNKELRKQIAVTLEAYGWHAGALNAIYALIDLIRDSDGDEEVSHSAAETLKSYGEYHDFTKEVVKPLVEILLAGADSTTSAKVGAAIALQGYGQYPGAAPAIQPLCEILSSETENNETLLIQVIETLAEDGGHPQAVSAVEPLLKLLSDPDCDFFMFAAEALEKYGDYSHMVVAIEPLVELLLTSEDEDIRRLCAETLASYGSRTQANMAILPLVNALADPDHGVRRSAAYALRNYSSHPEISEALKPLINLLTDPHSHVRSSAADTLGYIGDSTVLPVLEGLAASNDVAEGWLHFDERLSLNGITVREIARRSATWIKLKEKP